MPLARAVVRMAASAIGAALLAACAVADIPSSEEFARMPREIRLGQADMVIAAVERGVGQDEVMQALQTMVAAEPVCFSWPGLWLAQSPRRNYYYARYDLMARDWGEDFAAASEARMEEFVAVGFLARQDRPDMGERVVEYTPTTDGVEYLRGSPYGGPRPEFCAPSQRRVVEIVAMEWGDFPCGNLHVRFSHTADNWPTWARTERARQTVAETWPPIGELAQGEVTLARQWFRRNQLPSGRTNGALQSVCYDSGAQRVTGDDLNLNL